MEFLEYHRLEENLSVNEGQEIDVQQVTDQVDQATTHHVSVPNEGKHY